MRDWRSWLVPILTLLAVACLTVLPPRLSDWGDRELTGFVHAEALREDNNFPVRPPVLERRLELAAAGDRSDSGLMEVWREPGAREASELTEQVRKELRELGELGLFPPEASELTEFDFSYLYLRDSRDLASARFIRAYNRQIPLFLLLDGETGRALRVRIYDWRCPLDPAEAGAAFLERLGLAGELVSRGGGFADFRVPGSGAEYTVLLYNSQTEILPRLEQAAGEAALGALAQTAQKYDA